MQRAQLEWRCRRGMRELDLLLRRYLDESYETAAPPEQRLFQRLLEQPDALLWRYLCGGAEPEDGELAGLIRKIRRAAASDS
jgi:antitoxin CptB